MATVEVAGPIDTSHRNEYALRPKRRDVLHRTSVNPVGCITAIGCHICKRSILYIELHHSPQEIIGRGVFIRLIDPAK